jgi:hypothetical protein
MASAASGSRGTSGEVLQGDVGHQRLAVFQRVQQGGHRVARAAGRQGDGRRHTLFAAAVAQTRGRRRRRRGVAEDRQPRDGRCPLLRRAAGRSGDQLRHFLRTRGQRIAAHVMALEAGDLPVAVGLQLHQAGDRDVVAAKPMRLARAGQP